MIAVSPHPDDEILGAGATLMAFREAGWRVINLACGLGREDDRERRRAELVESCRLARFELIILDGIPPLAGGDDADVARSALSAAIAVELARSRVELVVSPSPHDGHPGHEVVGRAVCDAVESTARPLEVMLWGLWGDLPVPNVLVPFDQSRLEELRHALRAHAGELERNRYDRLLESRAAANAVLGAERVFGFGSRGSQRPYAELLMDVRWSPGGGWRLTAPRELDPALPAADAGPEIGSWLRAPSVRSQLTRSCMERA